MSQKGYEYQSDFARKYFGAGKAEGEAKGLAGAMLAVLETRSIEVPAELQAEILGCRDLEILRGWLCRAATATCIEDVID